MVACKEMTLLAGLYNVGISRIRTHRTPKYRYADQDNMQNYPPGLATSYNPRTLGDHWPSSIKSANVISQWAMLHSLQFLYKTLRNDQSCASSHQLQKVT